MRAYKLSYCGNFRVPLLIGLAGVALTLLLLFAQQAQAQAVASEPDNLGSVSGTVTDANGVVLTNVEVVLYTQQGSYNTLTTRTDANGFYRLTLVLPGIYRLQFRDPTQHYAPQWYANSQTYALATPIVVTGQPITGVNASLVLGGHISGTVTVQQLAPARGGWVSFYIQQANQWQELPSVAISSTGQYVSEGLLPGVYRLCATVFIPGASHYLRGCYGGPTIEQATNLVLGAAENKADVNLDVGEGAFDSVLGGVVTADGAPKAGIKVTVYNSNKVEYGLTALVYGFTDLTGRYRIGGLDSGQYWIEFSDPAGIYATTYYTHLQNIKDSPTVSLQASQEISTINGTLGHGGSLQGNVHRYTGQPVANVPVMLWHQSNGLTASEWYVTNLYTTTDAAGNYTLRGLWPGVYRVGIDCYPTYYTTACTEYYGSKRSVFLAKDVVIQADQTTKDINVTYGLENPVFMPIMLKSR